MTPIDRSIAPDTCMSVSNVQIPPVKTITLDNGIPVTVVDSGSQDVHRLTLMRDGGNVEASRPSVANVADQKLREGSEHFSGGDISDRLEFNGAWVKGMVQPHNSSVVLYALNDTADHVYPILRDMVVNRVFPDEARNAIKENLAGTLETNMKRVEYWSQVAVRDMIFGRNHRLSRRESPDDIRNIAKPALAQFHESYIQPAGIQIYMAGKITEDLLQKLNSYFGTGDVQHDADGDKLIINPAEPEAAGTDAVKVINVKSATQSSVRMAIPVVGRNTPDYIPLRIATVALGGYFGSRLMSNIREEKGLTYGINAGLYGYREGSMVMISAQTSDETVKALIEETYNEIERLKTGVMSAEEIARLKKFMYTQLLAQLDSPFSIMDYYENLRVNAIEGDYFMDQWRKIDSITADEIGEMARKYYDPDKMCVAVAGNRDAIDIA